MKVACPKLDVAERVNGCKWITYPRLHALSTRLPTDLYFASVSLAKYVFFFFFFFFFFIYLCDIIMSLLGLYRVDFTGESCGRFQDLLSLLDVYYGNTSCHRQKSFVRFSSQLLLIRSAAFSAAASTVAWR